MFSPRGKINFSCYTVDWVEAVVIVLSKHTTDEDWTFNLQSSTHFKDILENSR